MPLSPTAIHSLRRVFNEGFSVRDIAEPLVSFDTTASALEVHSIMKDKGYEVVGLRSLGIVAGYLEKSELDDGLCGDYLHEFDEAQVVDDMASLSQVVLALQESPRLFISQLGRVGGIVTRTDLQKPPVRMWLFGMVTLMEMRLTRLIELFCPNDSWKQHLSEGRVQKAVDLLKERTRRNQHIDLLDCVQFADKGQIVARNEEIRQATRFESRRQIEKVFKGLESFRNNLAHSQDIIATDWEIIVQLSSNLDSILEGPQALRDSDAR